MTTRKDRATEEEVAENISNLKPTEEATKTYVVTQPDGTQNVVEQAADLPMPQAKTIEEIRDEKDENSESVTDESEDDEETPAKSARKSSKK